MFTLLTSFWAYFPPEHFPSHYSAFPLQRYAVFNLPFVSHFLAWGSEYNNYVSFFYSYLAHHLLYFNTCHKVHFGNWSGLKEKESSSSHKHLDNCLLQHEKQLEVSGSWRRREAAGAAGQWFVLSVRGGTGQREVRGEAGFFLGNEGIEQVWPKLCAGTVRRRKENDARCQRKGNCGTSRGS